MRLNFFVDPRTWPLIALTIAIAACSSTPPPPPEVVAPVSSVIAVAKTMPERISAVGTVEAINSVAVKSLVDGQLLEIHVNDGDDVKAGQLLFKIDARPAQATLAQVNAALAKDVAARDLSKAQVDRYQPVATKGFISADQMQQYLTAYAAANASVKVDQANVEAARLTLGYTDIYAPISGRAGRILVQRGNLVKANDTQALLVINQITPIFVNFSVPGRYVDRVRGAQSQSPLVVSAIDDGTKGSQSGFVAFVDNAVDPTTNTVRVRARFDNGAQQLWPGQFVNIAMTVGNDANAIVVPDAAVKSGPNGNYVFIVKSDNRVEQRSVDVARSVDGESVVTRGLGAGDNVVTDGQSRLVDGTKVKIATVSTSNSAGAASATQ